MSFADLCREFIAIDTSPGAGTLKAARWLKELAETYGLLVELQEEVFLGREQANIFIRWDAAMERELVLQSHMDTPDPGSFALWTENFSNPYHAVVRDNRLYGLGVTGAKIDLLCKLEALRSFVDRRRWHRLNPVVVGTYGEEMGMSGMLRAIRRNKFSAQFALVGQPSDLQLISSGKGYAVLNLAIPFCQEEIDYRKAHNLKESASSQSKIFSGKPVHTGVRDDVEGAIDKALDYLLKLPNNVVLMEIEGGTSHNLTASHVFLELDLGAGLDGEGSRSLDHCTEGSNLLDQKLANKTLVDQTLVAPKLMASKLMVQKLKEIYLTIRAMSAEFLLIQDEEFEPSHPTFNFGFIRSHEDSVEFTITFRFPPVIEEDQYQGWLKRLQASLKSVQGDCRVLDYKRPYRADKNSSFVQTCRAALESQGAEGRLKSHSVCTEMSLLERIGVVGLGFGAGTFEETASFSKESVRLQDLEKSIEFYKTIIERVCL